VARFVRHRQETCTEPGVSGTVAAAELLEQSAESAFVQTIIEFAFLREEARGFGAEVEALDVDVAQRHVSRCDEKAQTIRAPL
jgi:hypothetical protein